jgi:hypothetical protein
MTLYSFSRPPPLHHHCNKYNHHDAISTTKYRTRLTVRFLVSGSGTWTTEFLGLAPSVVGDEECAVVLNKCLFQLVLGVLIDVLLVVGDNRLGNGLSNSIDLRGVTTTSNSDTDVNLGELVETDDQERLVDL